MAWLRKLISCVLLVAILCAQVVPTAWALTTDDPGFAVSNVEVTVDGTEDKTATIDFYGMAAENYAFITGQYATGAIQNGQVSSIYLTSMLLGGSIVEDDYYNYTDTNTGDFALFTETAPYTFAAEAPIVSATYTVPKDTPSGSYQVVVSLIEAQNDKNVYLDYYDNPYKYTATITVVNTSEGSGTPDTPVENDYSIYYELDDNKSDSDSDGYFEYEIGDTVTAEVYIQSKADVQLQAYDVFLTYGDDLVYQSATVNAYNAEGAKAATGEKVTHIQMVGKNSSAINLTDGTPELVGTITFTVAGTAVYDKGIDLQIIDGEETDNVTNISVGNGNAGDTESYYPVAEDNGYKGVEILTTYEVVYDDNADGEISVPNAQVKQHNVELMLSSSVPTRSGYQFTGWNTASDGSGTAYAAGAIYNGNEDLYLYAQWSQNTHTVTWYNADGSVIYTAQIAENESATYEEENYDVPEKTGEGYTYTFVGWNTQADAETALDSIIVTGDMSLYPVFSKEIHTWTVTTNDHDDSFYKSYAFEYGETVTGIEEPAREGYTFAGWTPALPETMPDNDVTVTATYTANEIKVTLKYEDGVTADVTENVTFDGTYESLIPAADPTREGYTFVQWVDDNGNQVTAESKVENAEEHTITAEWQEHTYTVTVYPNGGEGTAYTETYSYSQEWQIPAADTFSKVNYVFNGWTTSFDGSGSKYAAGSTVSKLTAADGGTISLYAQWAQDVYKITYQSNLDTVANIVYPADATYSDLTGIIINALTDFEEGYTFLGWTSEDLAISEPSQTITIPAGTGKNVTLVANFDPIEYTITFQNENATHFIITAEYESTIDYAQLTDPTKVGYTFDGWDVDPLPETMPVNGKTINAKWTVNQYTIKFVDTDGSTIEEVTKNFGDAITAPEIPVKTGFTNNGWDKTVPETMPVLDGEMIITAQRIEHTYTVNFDTDGGTPEVDSMENVKYTAALDMSTANSITKPGYELTGWNDGTTTYPVDTEISKLTAENNGTVTLTAVWEAAKYTLTFDLGAHPAAGVTVPDSIEVTYGQTYPELPSVVPAAGYNKLEGWYIDVDDDNTVIKSGDIVAITENTTVTAKYALIGYTITLELDGGNLPEDTTNPFSYTIETNLTLPTPNKVNSRFAGWKVTAVDENETNWAINAEFTPDGLTISAGQYGNVTLTAKWEVAVSLAVEEYGYVGTQYTLLRVADDLNDETKTYQFDGVSMYWTDDANYLVAAGDAGVFYTLVESTYVTDGQLTDAGLEKLTTATADCAKITYNGEINNDSVLNVADANIVYQMIQNGATYYGMGQLSIEQRLAADVDSTDVTGTQHRATIADVNKIVNKINGIE